MLFLRIQAAAVAVLLLASCSGPENPPREKVSFEEIASQLKEMDYQQSDSGRGGWHHSSSPSRQETPSIYLREGSDGWQVSFVDFDIFYCRTTAHLKPQEAIERSKEIFSTVPAKDRVAVPKNPDRRGIEENGLDCHVGRGG